MTIIFYSEIKPLFTDKEINMVNRFYNTEMIARVKKTHSPLYRNRRITFMCMMFKICSFFNLPFSLLKSIYHNDYGKLMMEHYNIAVSYSGKYVFCMLSDFKTGLDVELINDKISENEFKTFNYFFKTEITEHLAFFKEWTLLESIVKYFDDKGIKDFMHNSINNREYDLETIHMVLEKSYVIAISAVRLFSIKDKIKIKKI